MNREKKKEKNAGEEILEEDHKRWKNILKFLKGQKVVLIFYLLIGVLYPITFYLYGFSLEPIFYSFLMLSFFLLIFLCVDFVRQSNRAKQIQWFGKKSMEELPSPVTQVEEAYQRNLKELYERMEEDLSRESKSNQERLDYFMIWIHQIKTPIAALSLQIQKKEREGDSVRGLKTELFRIEQYVEMVLQYLRIEHIESDLDLYPVSLKKVVNAAVRKYSPIFIEKKLSLDLKNLDITVISDEKWLSLLIEQLLSNGLKYTTQGGIRIYTKDQNELIIEDTGIGIRKEDTKRVFENGFTGFNGRVDKKASGLGLFLCKKVAKQLGIQIHLTSKLQEGTKVSLIFKEKQIQLFS